MFQCYGELIFSNASLVVGKAPSGATCKTVFHCYSGLVIVIFSNCDFNVAFNFGINKLFWKIIS